MINSTTVKNEYNTSGVAATEYPITFQGITYTNRVPNIIVELKRAGELSYRTLTYTTEYTIVKNGTSTNIKIVKSADYAQHGHLRITRATPFTQDIDFQVGRIDPEQLEDSADRSVLRDQELINKLEVTLATPINHEERIQALETAVDEVQALIPTQATEENQLADKNFVNSSIATNTANYISDNGQPFQSVAALEAYAGVVTNNDYAFVTGTDEHGNVYFDRYKATVSGATVTWAKEYRLNNSSFTANQWNSINSGVTSADVTKVRALPVLITEIYVDGSGVLYVTAASNITSISVKKIIGHTVIAGNWAINGVSAVFTPTTYTDIFFGEWVVEVS